MSKTITTNPLDLAIQYCIKTGLLDNVRTLGIDKERMSAHIRYDGSDDIYMSITRCGFRTNDEGVTTLNFNWDSEDGYGSVSIPVK